MTALALHCPFGRSDAGRWVVAAIAVIALHAALAMLAALWLARPVATGTDIDAIAVELASASASPEISSDDLAPGPLMQEANAPAPEPEPAKPNETAEAIPPTPQQAEAEAPAPRELDLRPQVAPEPPTPQRTREQEPKPHPAERQPATPRTTAPPKAARQGPQATAAVNGAAAAAAAASYGARLAAHLQRFKQYPAAARSAGEQGVSQLRFVVSRGGAVLSASLAASSGHQALDAETMALIRRAQPLPPFPPEMQEASRSYTVPIRYSLR